MTKFIVRLFESLLRFLFSSADRPGSAKSRPPRSQHAPHPAPAYVVPYELAPPRTVFVFALGCLHGHGLPPVCGGERHRPLFFACRRTEYERRQRVENRRRRQRRRALWLAVHGVDVGPRVIHGMEVAA